MSELTPVDLDAGTARFDGRSLAIPEAGFLATPEAGGPAMPGQTGPFVMTGLTWLGLPASAAPVPAPVRSALGPIRAALPVPLPVTPTVANGFDVTLAGAAAVRLDLTRMAIATDRPVTGTVTTDGALELRLAGAWSGAPTVTVGGLPVAAQVVAGALVFQVPAGTSVVTIA